MSGFEKAGSIFARGAASAAIAPSASRPAGDTVDGGRTRPSRILVVEDQDDVRRMLVTALEIEGHHVDEAASAAGGLECLRRSTYDLVLTDYAMPGGTGTWMLQEAERRRLMDNAVALVVTAHPEVQELAGVDVVAKPLELDLFLQQVRSILAGRRQPDDPMAQPVPAAARARGHLVELLLYISSASPSSIQARHNLERLLAGFNRAQVKFTVCDLSRDAAGGARDRIAFTPTLVKRYPEPRLCILGNLSEPQIVADLLRVYGVEPAE